MEKKEKIISAYIEYVLENDKRPASVYTFAKGLKMKEAEIYDVFTSFEALEKEIWLGFFNETLSKIQSEEVYQNYTSREKLLAFYYGFFEVLKNNRSFVLHYKKRNFMDALLNSPLSSFKKSYVEFVSELIEAAKDKKEVITRPIITDKYKDLLWFQMRILLNYWIKDHSAGFEKTDAMVEKAVNMSFDLMGSTPLDSVVDMAKFIFQSR